MKKITAFFLVLLPFFITGLMFISGLIQSINYPVSVVGISIAEPDQDVCWDKKDDKPYSGETIQFHAHVLPLNAKNQEIQWESSDSNIIDVNDEGKLTIKGYGKVTITATALGNKNVFATREVDSFDTIAHGLKFTNVDDINYLSAGQVVKPTIEVEPSIDHMEQVESITYSLSKNEVLLDDGNVSIDQHTGIITVKKDEERQSKTSTIYSLIKTKSGERQGNQDADQLINFGPAVDAIAWENPNDETILDDTYNLFDNFKTAPANKKTKETPDGTINATDFIYESQNTDVATVDANGVVEFKPGKVNEYATFTVTYKRNKDLKISKRIQSNGSNFKQVFFKDAALDIDFENGKNIAKKVKGEPEPDLDWYTYPQDGMFAEVNITSTDSNVIEVDNGNETRPAVYLRNPGKCGLKISTTVGDEVISDVCEVNVKPTSEFVKSDPVTTEKETPYYYPLVNNLNIAKSSIGSQTISFTIIDGGSDDTYIDKNNILHFKKAVTNPITIKATVNDNLEETFKITTNTEAKVQTQEPTDFKTIVGQPIKLNNAKAVFAGKHYESFFDVDDDVFTAKRGCDIPEFELENGNKIHLIVREDPIYIKSTSDVPLYSTPDEEVDFVNTFNANIFPSTATKDDGSGYNPEYKCVFDNGTSTGSRDGNILRFSRIGCCEITANFGYINGKKTSEADQKLTSNYIVRCTYNDEIGKFKVTKNDALLPWRRTVMNQYDEWDTTESLRIDDVRYSLYEGLQAKSLNGLCNPTISWTGLVATGHIVLNANPIAGKYGKDVIEISSPTYSLFLNVNLDTIISDFTVTYKNDVLDNQLINTYIDLNDVRITPNTAGVKSDLPWSWRLLDSNNNPIAYKDDVEGTQIVSLPFEANGQYRLILSANGKDIKQYTFNKKDISNVEVSLYGCDDGIYASCNSNTKSALIITDGYVQDSFYSDLKVELSGGGFDTKRDLSFNTLGNILTITNISENTNGGKLTLTNGTIKKEYVIGRDQVSKIKLPGHNTLDKSDKKGIQKIHVYGNYSYYPGIGEVNYYRVPVKLYDKSRSEIKNTESNPSRKYEVLKTLKITTTRNTTAVVDKADNGEFIRVYFDKNDLYSAEQIYNNAFDTKTGNNIDFSVSTKSNEVHADYKFVAVEGTNVYNQEGILKASKNQLKANAVVLQKNFGLVNYEDADNAKLDDPSFDQILGLYGNGYCLDLKTVSRKWVLEMKKDLQFGIKFALNADINGCDNETMFARGTESILSGSGNDYKNDRYYAYSTIHNFVGGTNFKADYKFFFKRCLFHSFFQRAFFYNGFNSDEKPEIYIEECDFFDCGKFGIWSMKDMPIYFKGDIKVYNFKDKEMLRDLPGGIDATALWPVLIGAARLNNMIHKDFKGDEVVNSFMCTVLNPYTYFWDYAQNKYVQSERGIPGSAKYLAKFAELGIKLLQATANMWGGTNPSYERGAPSYSEQYTPDGKLKLDFLYTLVSRDLIRHPTYF